MLNWENDLDLILLGYRSSTQSSSLYSPFELLYGVKARLPIELDLPPHKCQNDKDDNSMEKLMVSSKLLSEKCSDACVNIHIAQVTQKRQYDRKHCRLEEFVVGDEVWYANSRRDTRKGDKLSCRNMWEKHI